MKGTYLEVTFAEPLVYVSLSIKLPLKSSTLCLDSVVVTDEHGSRRDITELLLAETLDQGSSRLTSAGASTTYHATSW